MRAPLVFFINLDAATQRRRHMEGELTRLGLAFERVAGIPGAALPPELEPYFHAPEADASPWKLGEIGCHAAHLAACRRFLAASEGVADASALVLEDDVRLPENLPNLLARTLDALPPGWDIVRLANPPKRAYVPVADIGSGFDLVRYSKVPTLAGAYLLSRAGAQKLLRPGLRRHAIDEYLRRPWLASLDTFGVAPPPIGLMDFPSDIDAFEHRQSGPRIGVIRKNLRKSDLRNLPRRLSYDLRNIGAGAWLACLAINASDKLARRLFGRTLIHRLSQLLGPPDASKR